MSYMLVIYSFGTTAWSSDHNSPTMVALTWWFFVFVAFFVLQVGYQVVCTWLLGGTSGKLRWGLRVVRQDGMPAGIWRTMFRALAEVPSLLAIGLGYFVRSGGKTWHDVFAGTSVILAPRRTAPAVGSALALFLLGVGISASAPWMYAWRQSLEPPVDRHIRAGADAFTGGDNETALREFTMALAADPRSSLAHANRGAVYLEQGRLDLAIWDCTQAIDLDSTQIFAWMGRGNAHRELGSWALALADYTEAIRARPDWSGIVYAYLGRGAVHYRQKRLREAEADFRQGARVAMENYLGTSDHLKGAGFTAAIDLCHLFRREALQRLGEHAEADSVWARYGEMIAITVGNESERNRKITEYLGEVSPSGSAPDPSNVVRHVSDR